MASPISGQFQRRRMGHRAAIAAFLAMISLLIPHSFAQARDAVVQAQRWEVVDIPFEMRGPLPKDPFSVDFSASFTAPDGKTLKVPGFYNGGKQYLIRFSGNEAGVWRYRTSSPVASLNGQAGTVRVDGRAANRGPVVIDPAHPKRFRHASGAGHMLLAFELDWLFALDYHNDSALPKTQRIIDQVTANGFNHVVMNVYAYDVEWEKDAGLDPRHEYGGDESMFPFGGSNSKPDYSTLNVDFFKKLDRVIALLADRDVTAHLMIYVWNKKVSWPELGSADDNRYFDHVIARYAAYPNIHWDISKEALFYGKTNADYIVDRINRARRIDPFGRLVTVHDAEIAKRHADVIDYASIQNWTPDIAPYIRNFTKSMEKPVLMIENGCYEYTNYTVFRGNFEKAETCLDRTYRTIFSGAYGSHYWQSAAWNAVIDDVASMPEGQRPKLEYFRHMSRIFDGSKYSELVPLDGNACSGGYILTDNKMYFRIYVPAEGPGVGCSRLGEFEAGYKETWMNTLTGETTSNSFPGRKESKGRRDKPWPDAPAVLVIEPLPAS